MKAPAPIHQTIQIDTQISVIKCHIMGLEYGKDFLTSNDFKQLDEWNNEIKKLQQQKAAIVGVVEV